MLSSIPLITSSLVQLLSRVTFGRRENLSYISLFAYVDTSLCPNFNTSASASAHRYTLWFLCVNSRLIKYILAPSILSNIDNLSIVMSE